MPAIDPRYFIFVALLIAIFCTAVLFLVRRTFAGTIPGVSAWAWGCVLSVVTCVLLVIRPAAPSTFSIVLANIALTTTCLLFYVGLRTFRGRSVNYRLLACAWIALVGALTWFIHGDQYRFFISLSSLFIGTVFLASGGALLKVGKAGMIEWFTGAAFLLATSVCYARSITAALGFQAPTTLFDPWLMQKVYIASFPFVLLSTTIGFMLMINERVRAIVVDMNASLESAVEKRTAELREEINRRKALEREVADRLEKERRAIGRELHDNLGQRMTGLSLLAEALASKLKAISPDLFDQASALERMASESILETRRMAHGLMPVVPDAKGLRAALTELAEGVSLDGKLRCTFSADAPIEVDDEYVATQLFRIAQESVSNLIRHGHATAAAIRLGRANDKTTLTITDNGAGFLRRKDDQGGGRGLRIMAYRASLIGYDFRIESVPGSGTTIRVSEC